MPEIAHPVSNEAMASLIGAARAICEEFDHGARLGVSAVWPNGSKAAVIVPTTGRAPHRNGEWTSCFPVRADYEEAAARLINRPEPHEERFPSHADGLEAPCPLCDGTGIIGAVCPDCDGKGTYPTPLGEAILAFLGRHLRR